MLVVIDEAYREFDPDPEVPDGLEVAATNPNVLRAAYVFEGLRTCRSGSVMESAHDEVAEAIRMTSGAVRR